MSRRDQIRMTDAEVAAYLDAQHTLQFATINPDGTPHLVAMWFVVDEGRPAIWTYRKSQKVANLRRDPRVTALVESGTTYNDLRGVQIQGTARLVEDPAEVQALGEALFARYNDIPMNDLVRDSLAAQAKKRLGIVIEPERVVSWDHTKLGGTY